MWRRLLLALLFTIAQAATAAHALQHTVDDGIPSHACAVCLVGHNLGAAATASSPPLPAARLPEAPTESRLAAPPARRPLPANQRGPPLA